MPRCIVNSCGIAFVKDGDAKFHVVPSAKANIALRKEWLSNCGRIDILESDSKRVVCNKHFSSKCYRKNLRVDLIDRKLQYDLLPGSIPTIFKVIGYKLFQYCLYDLLLLTSVKLFEDILF